MGLLDGVLQQQQQQPQPQRGLLAGMAAGMQAPQQGAGGMQMPPEMQQAIQQMQDASPEQKQQFFQHMAQQIMSAPRPDNIKQQGIQMLKEGLGL